MIAHVVLMTPRADLPPEERRAFVAAFERAVREIPDVRGVRIGRRVPHGAGYEAGTAAAGAYLAIIDFDDLAGLHAYLAHPAHQELGARFRSAMDATLVYDFDVSGVDGLSGLV